MKNEKTSKRVAAIAGKVLATLNAYTLDRDWVGYVNGADQFMRVCTAGQLKALAASCLTQTSDRPKKAIRK